MKLVKESLTSDYNKRKDLKKVSVIPIGKITISTGTTGFDYNFYDVFKNGYAVLIRAIGDSIFFTSGENDFTVGEKVAIFMNDSGRFTKLGTVLGISPVIKEDLIEMLLDNGHDFRPKKPFQKYHNNNAFANRLNIAYSVKGIYY